MKKLGAIYHQKGPLKSVDELSPEEILLFLSKRYHYSVNTIRLYIYRGVIFSTKDVKEIYANLDRSDAEYLSYVKRVTEVREQNGRSVGKANKGTVASDKNSNKNNKKKVNFTSVSSIDVPSFSESLTTSPEVKEPSAESIQVEGGNISWSSSVFIQLKQDIDNQIEQLQLQKQSIEEVERLYEEYQSKQ